MTPADVKATIDVLSDVGESSDSLNVEDSVDMLEAVKEVLKKARETVGLIETQLVAILESPRIFGDTEYKIVSDGKWRPDHNKVQASIKNYSMCDRETGEIRNASDAVDEATRLFYACHVGPQQMPKVGGLDLLNLDKTDVAEFDRAGRKVRTTPIVPVDA